MKVLIVGNPYGLAFERLQQYGLKNDIEFVYVSSVDMDKSEFRGLNFDMVIVDEMVYQPESVVWNDPSDVKLKVKKPYYRKNERW